MCTIPAYRNELISKPRKVQVLVTTQYKDQVRVSSPMNFTYVPNEPRLSKSISVLNLATDRQESQIKTEAEPMKMDVIRVRKNDFDRYLVKR